MKPITVFVLALAPFLSLTDAAHGAPAGAVKVDAARHRRAAAESPDSLWQRRSSKRQDTEGPPAVIPVVIPPVDPSPNQDPSSSSTTDTSTSTSSTAASTDPVETPAQTTTSTSTDTSSSSSSSVDSSSTSSTSVIIDLPTSLFPPPSDSTTSTTSTDPPPETPTTTTTTTTTDPPPADTPTSTPTPDPITTTTTDTSTTDCGLLGIGCLGNAVTSAVGVVTSDVGVIVSTLTDSATNTFTDLPPVSNTDTVTITSSTDAPPPPPESSTTTPDGPVSTDTGIITSSTTSNVVSVGPVFPTTTDTGIDSIATTIIDSTTSKAPISIDSQYQFITASSFLIAPTTSTTGTVTITDPDAAPTTLSLLTNSGGGAVTLTAPVIPSSIPMFITPPQDSNPVPLGTDLSGYTEISILFQMTASWLWVLQSPDTAAQILAYLPPMIESALGCSNGDECVRTVGLKAFEPADLQTPSDLMTMYVGQLKSDLVNTLASIIKDPTSAFYNSGDPVADSVASNIVMSFNIATLSGVSNENGSNSPSSSTTTKLDNSRRNAIIGVSTAFGVVALIVIGWWMMRSYKARQEAAHKRLSYTNEKTYGTAAEGAGLGGGYGRADSPPMLQNPFLSEREREDEARGIRRNSFYAIGPDDASLEEETFDYMSHRSSHNGAAPGGGGGGLRREASNGSGGAGWGTAAQDRLSPSGSYSNHPYARRPVVGQPISQPILRESSMGNW